MTELPQMWELSALVQMEEKADAAEHMRTAILVEQASVALADRLRGATGWAASLRCVDGVAVTGSVELATADSVVLADGRQRLLVPLAAIAAATVSEIPPALPARGAERASARTVLRDLVDRGITLVITGGVEAAGVLVAVGSDHLALAADGRITMIPMAAVVRVGWRRDRELSPGPPD